MMMNPVRKSSDDGYTLLEVLVALVILSLATIGISLVAPQWTSSSSARTLLANIKATLADARDLALKESKIVVVTFDGVALRTGSIATIDIPAQAALRLETPDDQFRNNIAFFSDGSSTGGTITIENNGRKDAVSVSRLTGTMK